MPPLNTFIPNDVISDFPDIHVNEIDLKFAFATKRKNCASVCFNDNIRVEYLPNRQDWSEEEKRARWISNDEYTKFQLDVSNTLFMLKNEAESVDDTLHTSRGVECRDPIATQRRRNTRKESKAIVFEMQRIQRQQSKSDPLHIAGMYSILAQNAIQQARNFALLDELDAKKIQNNFHDIDDLDLFFNILQWD